MGKAIAELGWSRESYVISTKVFWGLSDTVNMRNTLNRKYLMHAIDGSLERFGLDFVDLLFCHRADPETPIEETVWAMSEIIGAGKAHYWGTSEWSADEIRAAWEIAERHHLHKPVMEQPQYNLLDRRRVEQEYARLYDDIGLGLTIWSPLASGLLTGKYARGEAPPEGTRLAAMGARAAAALNDRNFDRLEGLSTWAAERGKGLLDLAFAWLLGHAVVSSVIAGATRPEQVAANAAAGAWKLTSAEVGEVTKLAA
jgi:aryl-alcohol dehydrogenase-like predicted oxidoreductase